MRSAHTILIAIYLGTQPPAVKVESAIIPQVPAVRQRPALIIRTAIRLDIVRTAAKAAIAITHRVLVVPPPAQATLIVTYLGTPLIAAKAVPATIQALLALQRLLVPQTPLVIVLRIQPIVAEAVTATIQAQCAAAEVPRVPPILIAIPQVTQPIAA